MGIKTEFEKEKPVCEHKHVIKEYYEKWPPNPFSSYRNFPYITGEICYRMRAENVQSYIKHLDVIYHAHNLNKEKSKANKENHI